jgi:hypothetical protein
MGDEYTDPRILDLGTSWWVVSFTPRPLYPWRRTPSIHWPGGWVSSWPSLDDKKSKISPPLGLALRPLGRPARSQSLYRLYVYTYTDNYRCVIWCCISVLDFPVVQTPTIFKQSLSKRKFRYAAMFVICIGTFAGGMLGIKFHVHGTRPVRYLSLVREGNCISHSHLKVTVFHSIRKQHWTQYFFRWLFQPIQGPGLLFSSVIIFHMQ